MKNSHIRFVSSKNYFFIFIFPSSVSVTGSPKCPPPAFQEASLICKWECGTNQEWLDKAETQVFQHCVTDGELQRSYRPSFKEDLSCRTLCFSSQTLYTCDNSSSKLWLTGQVMDNSFCNHFTATCTSCSATALLDKWERCSSSIIFSEIEFNGYPQWTSHR